MKPIEYLVIGECECGKQVVCHTNPFSVAMKDLFVEFVHDDGTEVCK